LIGGVKEDWIHLHFRGCDEEWRRGIGRGRESCGGLEECERNQLPNL
jgi:hypothetical protein